MARGRQPLTDAPEALDVEQKQQIKRWVKERVDRKLLPREFMRPAVLHRHVDECLSWSGMNGVQRANWVRAVQNWLLKAPQFAQERRSRYRETEYPQEARSAGKRNMEALGDIIRIGKG